MRVTLTAKTKKGRERLKRDGDSWEVLRISTVALPFAPDDNGPWLFITSRKNDDTRWVRQTKDRDFIVEE